FSNISMVDVLTLNHPIGNLIPNDSFAESPLFMCFKKDKIATATLLLTRNYDLNVENSKGETILHFMCQNFNNSESLALISAFGAKWDAKTKSVGCKPINYAIFGTNMKNVFTFYNLCSKEDLAHTK
ncbi:MAG: hypothetical protein MHPSP_002987, partial [Paramarteilia canceri]